MRRRRLTWFLVLCAAVGCSDTSPVAPSFSAGANLNGIVEELEDHYQGVERRFSALISHGDSGDQVWLAVTTATTIQVASEDGTLEEVTIESVPLAVGDEIWVWVDPLSLPSLPPVYSASRLIVRR